MVASSGGFGQNQTRLRRRDGRRAPWFHHASPLRESGLAGRTQERSTRPLTGPSVHPYRIALRKQARGWFSFALHRTFSRGANLWGGALLVPVQAISYSVRFEYSTCSQIYTAKRTNPGSLHHDDGRPSSGRGHGTQRGGARRASLEGLRDHRGARGRL
jgi:hypothetical protein